MTSLVARKRLLEEINGIEAIGGVRSNRRLTGLHI
jgi:hypothetical protein